MNGFLACPVSANTDEVTAVKAEGLTQLFTQEVLFLSTRKSLSIRARGLIPGHLPLLTWSGSKRCSSCEKQDPLHGSTLEMQKGIVTVKMPTLP